MSAVFTVRLVGCDGETAVAMDLDPDELDTVKRLAEKAKATSRYACEPTVIIQVGDTTDHDET